MLFNSSKDNQGFSLVAKMTKDLHLLVVGLVWELWLLLELFFSVLLLLFCLVVFFGALGLLGMADFRAIL